MNDPQTHWLDMPDFDQPSQKPFATINVRVATEEDLIALSKALGQPLTAKTKSAWYPQAEPSGVGAKRWK